MIKALFREMRRLYEGKMCGFFRRHFSLKSLRSFKVLSVCTVTDSILLFIVSLTFWQYTPTTRPVAVPLDDFVLQEMMYAYLHPERVSSSNEWIEWVFRLRGRDKRHAIEFVEGWNSTRVAIAGTVPWLSSCLVAVIWSALGGDPQVAFTVAGFILSSSSGEYLSLLVSGT